MASNPSWPSTTTNFVLAPSLLVIPFVDLMAFDKIPMSSVFSSMNVPPLFLITSTWAFCRCSVVVSCSSSSSITGLDKSSITSLSPCLFEGSWVVDPVSSLVGWAVGSFPSSTEDTPVGSVVVVCSSTCSLSGWIVLVASASESASVDCLSVSAISPASMAALSICSSVASFSNCFCLYWYAISSALCPRIVLFSPLSVSRLIDITSPFSL